LFWSGSGFFRAKIRSYLSGRRGLLHHVEKVVLDKPAKRKLGLSVLKESAGTAESGSCSTGSCATASV
jgi:hypothetical protein